MTDFLTADFFAGWGLFSKGAEQAGARVVLAANHWPAAIEWHRRNHPDTEHVCQELGEFDKNRIPDVDLLIASPACQGFSSNSTKGKAKVATNGKPGRVVKHQNPKHQADRNTSYAVISAADVKRPQHIIVENVVEMLEWELFPAWRAFFEAMGYHVREHRFNATEFGVPQDRDRAIITMSKARPVEIVPPSVAPQTIADVLDDEPDTDWVPIASKTRVSKKGVMADRMRSAQRAAGGSGLMFWANVDSAVARPVGTSVFPTITTKTIGQGYILDGDHCRAITARELARGQGAPDSYQLPGDRTLAGKLIGNAIPAPLARAAVEQVRAAA